jgi:hypothetical protein
VVQLAQVSSDHPKTAELVSIAEAGNAVFEPQWWSTPADRASERCPLRRVVMSTPSLPAAVGFFAGLLEGEVLAEDDTTAELAWPGGAHVRLELQADAAPGFLRLEVERAGPTETVDVSGTRVRLTSPSD